MLVFPNAKINIGLFITEKRPDDFHNLETIFYPINLTDILEFTESNDKTRFTNTGLRISGPKKNNLVLKAYYLIKNQYKLPELNIHLHKIIPFDAGLGGGSSDAAFMLKSLNSYFNLQISDDELKKYAQQLGSDCPFFIKNNPIFAEGTGNIFSEITFDLSRYYILIVKPDIHISTKDAFFEIIPEIPEISIKELIKLPINSWKGKISNDFEKSVFKLYPEIKQIKDNLYRAGALYAQMSGSGSAAFGFFKREPDIQKYFTGYFTFLQKPE